jgi:hypothetical protein
VDCDDYVHFCLMTVMNLMNESHVWDLWFAIQWKANVYRCEAEDLIMLTDLICWMYFKWKGSDILHDLFSDNFNIIFVLNFKLMIRKLSILTSFSLLCNLQISSNKNEHKRNTANFNHLEKFLSTTWDTIQITPTHRSK